MMVPQERKEKEVCPVTCDQDHKVDLDCPVLKANEVPKVDQVHRVSLDNEDKRENPVQWVLMVPLDDQDLQVSEVNLKREIEARLESVVALDSKAKTENPA